MKRLALFFSFIGVFLASPKVASTNIGVYQNPLDKPTGAESSTFYVYIAGDAGWVDTGVTVDVCDSLTMSATGLVSGALGVPPSNPPDGSGYGPADSNYLAPGLEKYSLVGRIGDHPPFQVGSSYSSLSNYSGILYLAYNDEHYPDNSGGYDVYGTVISPTFISGEITADTTWDLSGSPYIVKGDVIVSEGATLAIDPMVEVKFDGFYSIKVLGTLLAVGSKDSMITFTSNSDSPSPGDWKSIELHNGDDSHIKYCKIFYASEGIVVYNASIVENSIIKYGNSYGIILKNGSPTIKNNLIQTINHTGIKCDYGSPLISGNIIYDNFDGIVTDYASSYIVNNLIYNNQRYGIDNRNADDYSVTSTIVNNTLDGNGILGSGPHGANINCDNSSPVIKNNIITDSDRAGIRVTSGGAPTISYNDIWNNGTNYFGASSGPGDISVNPLYVDRSNGDYHLDDRSPCIGAATSDGAPSIDINENPRGSPPDMGAYENPLDAPQDIRISVSPTSIDFDTVQVGLSSSEGTVIIQHIGISDTLSGNVSLSGANSGDFQITQGGGSYNLFPGQSRTVKVKFVPTATGLRSAVLHIIHNATDESSPINVLLTGTGIPTAQVPIDPIVSMSQLPGAEFWVEMKVGSESQPVNDLFGLSFELNFTNTAYIDVVTPHSANVTPGDFLGTDLVFFSNVDDDSGKVSVGISRKAGVGGVSGSGVVAKVKFKSLINTPSGTQVNFTLTNVTANDPSGQTISLIPGSATVIIEGLIVWPGDTNNDGVVNQADVLPLGLYWAKTGPSRTGASTNWVAQPALPWTPQNATYADANGDGIVNQADVLPIGLNWAKTHSTSILASMSNQLQKSVVLSPTLKPIVQPAGKECWVDIKAIDVTDLFGVAFELRYIPKEIIDSVYVEAGTFMGGDVIFYPVVEKDSGKVSVGITRKAGQGGVNGDGVVVKVFLRALPTTPDNTEITLTLENITAIDPQGNPIQFDTASANFITEVENDSIVPIPKEFLLSQNFPNPFNTTTIIQYQLAKPSHVTIIVYNLLGQEIKTLINEEKEPGYFTVPWDGKDSDGQEVAGGVYIYRIQAGKFMGTKKMLLLK